LIKKQKHYYSGADTFFLINGAGTDKHVHLKKMSLYTELTLLNSMINKGKI